MPKNLRVIYAIAWAGVALITLINLIWANRIGFRVETRSAVQSVKVIVVLVVITSLLWVVSRIRFRNALRKSFYGNVAHTSMWIALLAIFTHVCAVFQYLCVATNFPLVSNTLISADAALGFHWLDAYQWVRSHGWVHSVLQFAYASGGYQLFVIPMILAVTCHARDYAELVVQFMLAAIVTLAIAVFLPAESAFVHFGIHDPHTASTVSDFATMRSGQLHALSLLATQGLVSFPSLHTILGLCFAYSMRHLRLVFPVAIVLNSVMIVSTPTQGGHYLVDTLAGLVVGALVIYVVRRAFSAAGRQGLHLSANPPEDPARPVRGAAAKVSAR